MKIVFNLSDFLAALDVVAIVQPMVVQNLPAGYLFVVEGDTCKLYSRNEMSVARASFKLTSSTGDGQFVYPASFLGALRYLGADETCTMDATEGPDNFRVHYETSSGAESERSTIDPQLLFSTCDEDLAESTLKYEFKAKVLLEAIKQAKPFLGDCKKQEVPENFKGLQIIDATLVDKAKGIDYSKGDGYMFAGDGVRTFFFHCEDFKGKSLEIHGQHLSAFQSFLAKCGETVTVHKGGHFTFAENESGQLLGWTRHIHLHDKFNYFSLKNDQIVLRFSRARFLNSLHHTRSELDKDENKIKFSFDADAKQVSFTFEGAKSKTKSIPVPVSTKDGESYTGFLLGGNIDHLIELVDLAKGNDIEFRNRIFPADATRKHDVGLLRTIDEFNLDQTGKVTPESEGNHKCRVTRYMSSKD